MKVQTVKMVRIARVKSLQKNGGEWEGNSLQIGNVTIEGHTALAPMAGVADRSFRTICKELGASYLVGEMASAKGDVYKRQ